MGVKISELNEALSVQNSDLLPIVQNGETKKISKEIFLKSVLSLTNNSGFHNSIYRGKDITDLFYNGTLSQQIAAGTFDDIYIGDYIIGQNSGRKYLVADINYYLHSGEPSCNTNHIVMIPDKIIGTGQMNTSDTTTGAYTGSAMYTTNLSSARTLIKNDFGTSHVLSHGEYLANSVASSGYENGGIWTSVDLTLMNEIMIFGSNILHNVQHGTNIPIFITIDNSQLSIFRLKKEAMIGFDTSNQKDNYWLRDVASSNTFSIVGSSGFVSHIAASRTAGIRPSFLVY